MNAVAQTLIDGLIDHELMVGASINYAGADYPCCGGAEFTGKLLTEGGFRTNADVTIAIRLAILPGGAGRPAAKQRITYTSTPGATARSLKIDNVNVFHDALLILECMAVNAGA